VELPLSKCWTTDTRFAVSSYFLRIFFFGCKFSVTIPKSWGEEPPQSELNQNISAVGGDVPKAAFKFISHTRTAPCEQKDLITENRARGNPMRSPSCLRCWGQTRSSSRNATESVSRQPIRDTQTPRLKGLTKLSHTRSVELVFLTYTRALKRSEKILGIFLTTIRWRIVKQCECLQVCPRVCVCVCLYVCFYLCMYLFVRTYVCMCVYMYLCLCIYVCIY
jgi:hypothetical protein